MDTTTQTPEPVCIVLRIRIPDGFSLFPANNFIAPPMLSRLLALALKKAGVKIVPAVEGQEPIAQAGPLNDYTSIFWVSDHRLALRTLAIELAAVMLLQNSVIHWLCPDEMIFRQLPTGSADAPLTLDILRAEIAAINKRSIQITGDAVANARRTLTACQTALVALTGNPTPPPVPPISQP